ncbi:endo-arabinase [Flavobacterium sandaracinum]|uniref:Endo-arabinase n=1 Tax=Flavobacterium sandaracinum TaxID=2541733 RepID=A0A4R5D4Z0_9FLAO|nr:endo-arabinase [Flavobacterium sandaracinum]TDE06900.1 endo-arabinase [Flavobacterium sandaracinum]
MNCKSLIYLLVIASLIACKQKSDESEKIKKLLETESATWRARDGKAHAECWHIQPYSRILVSTADGKTLDIPAIAMTNTDPKSMGNGGYSVNTNYKMSIKENNAWVSHDEVSTAKDGKRSYSHEIRLVEKIKGQWKLVGQSIHVYKSER